MVGQVKDKTVKTVIITYDGILFIEDKMSVTEHD